MATFQWTLVNTVSGTLVLTSDPKGWEEVELNLERDVTRFHGVFQEWAFDLQFHCGGGGKEYIDNIYETQGVDALITLLIEYACPDGTLERLFAGKLNLSKYVNTSKDSAEVFTQVAIERNDITQIVRDRSDVKINLNSLTSLDGSALTAYVNAPALINAGSQTIDLQSEIDGGPLIDSDTFPGLDIVLNPTNNIYMESALPVISDDLETISDNTNFSAIGVGLAIGASGAIPFYQANSDIIDYSETYTFTWDFTGDWTDCASVAITRSVAAISLILFIGQELSTATATTLGTIAVPGAGATVCPIVTTVPFAFVGGAALTVNFQDKMWLVWAHIPYMVTAGPPPGVPFTVIIAINYFTSQLIMDVASSITPGTNAGFAIYETWARVSESVTDQPTFAFKSDFFGRTDSLPSAGGAPVYVADGCGSLNFIFSGLSLRGYGKQKLETPLPDFTTIDELFDSCDSVWNIGLSIEQHSGQDVVRVEEKDFFYDSTVIISLSNVPNIVWNVDTSFMWNEFEIGFQQWKPENFNGLDEICTKHEYDFPITTIKNKLSRLSPILASGYAIEDIKRISENQGEDHKYDNNNFFIAVRRVLGTFQSEDNQDFLATAGIDNPGTRRNMKLTPKHNFLRWLNVLGSGLTKQAGATINFRYAEGEYFFTTTIDPASAYFGCNGDYTGVLLDEDGDIAWDDASARLNAPLWIPEVYEFDFPLTFTEYKTIRDAPNGVIQFRPDATSTFKSGYILELKFKLQGGLTHFKLLRRFIP